MVLLMLPHLCMEGVVHIQLVANCRPLSAPPEHVKPGMTHWGAVEFHHCFIQDK